jgi:hypothetical protein
VSADTTYAVGQAVRVLVGLHAGKRAVVHELDGGGYWCRPDGVATPALYEAGELEPDQPFAPPAGAVPTWGGYVPPSLDAIGPGNVLAAGAPGWRASAAALAPVLPRYSPAGLASLVGAR